MDAFGGVDILVNNAGILRDRTLLKTSEEDWDAVIEVHLKGTFTMMQAAAQRMVEQGGVKVDGQKVIARQSDGIHFNDEGAVVPARLVLEAIAEDFPALRQGEPATRRMP